MDVGTNKTRKDTRAVVSLVARYRSPSTFEYVEEACCDVSLGGMFIRSKDPSAAGTLLKLECESGDDVGAQIRGVARVVWLRSQESEYGPSGMGVKFVKLDPESRDVITRIVQELTEAGVESPSMSSAPEQRGKPPSNRSLNPPSVSDAPAERVAAAAVSTPNGRPSKPVNPTVQEFAAVPRSSVPAPKEIAARVSSKPPSLPVSSQPPPSGALLARANVEPIEPPPVNPEDRPSMRDLRPLQAMVRSVGTHSEPPPPSESNRGRAFWLVAGAVVALGGIVLLFTLRSAREVSPQDAQAFAGATPDQAVATPPPAAPAAPSAPNAMERTQAEPEAAPQGATAEPTPSEEPTQLAAQEPPQAEAPPSADAVQEIAPAATDNATDVPPAEVAIAQEPAAEPKAKNTAVAASEGAAAPSPTANAVPRQVAPPVLRITPAEPAAAPPQPSAAAEASATKPPPPALAPGEIAHVITFTSRPPAATILVEGQSVTTPGELNLGAMPTKIRVTAEKEGFESSTVWINNTAEFVKTGGVLRREVHFVLKALPPPPPGAPAPATSVRPATSTEAKPQSAPPEPAPQPSPEPSAGASTLPVQTASPALAIPSQP